MEDLEERRVEQQVNNLFLVKVILTIGNQNIYINMCMCVCEIVLYNVPSILSLQVTWHRSLASLKLQDITYSTVVHCPMHSIKVTGTPKSLFVKTW